MRVFIIGGCVSRDQMRYLGNFGYELVDYIARQNFISAQSQGSSDPLDSSLFSSSFQMRAIDADFRGDMWERIESQKDDFDVLLLDLYSLRRGALQLEDGNWVTDNWELVETGQREKLNIRRELAFGTDEFFDRWRDGADVFLTLLDKLGIMRKLRVIAPRVAFSYLDGSVDHELAEAELISEQYKPYEEFFRNNDVELISLPEEQLFATQDHRWGPRPFHFSVPTESKISREIRASCAKLVFTDSEYNCFKEARKKIHEDLALSDETNLMGAVKCNGFQQYISHDGLNDSNRLTFFFNGAIDPQRAKGKPVFQRSTWWSDVNGSCVGIADPTQDRDPELSLGWGQGSADAWGLPLQAGVVAGVIDYWREIHGLESDEGEVQLYGSSGGGFQALAVATIVDPHRVIVNNPQVDWLKYEGRSAVQSAIESCYGRYANRPGFREKWAKRVSVIELWNRSCFAPRWEYFLNSASSADMKLQFGPLNQFLGTNKGGRIGGEGVLNMYSDFVAGHDPLNKPATIDLINRPFRRIGVNL